MNVFEDLDERAEQEFRTKCEEFAMYGHVERTTLDGEWTEEDLRDDIFDVCAEVMTEKLLKDYEHRALHNRDLLKKQYMADTILNDIEDVIELYNTEVDKHRASFETEHYFGIHWYDEAIKKMVIKKLKENVVCN